MCIRDSYAGYGGPALPQEEYLGWGVLAVGAAGLILWRRQRRLWFFTALGAVAVVLSLGVQNSYWVPWRILARIPVVQNITVGRFMAVTTLCAAVIVALVIDRTHGSVAGWVRRRRPAPAGRHHRSRGRGVAVTAGLAALAVCLLYTSRCV